MILPIWPHERAEHAAGALGIPQDQEWAGIWPEEPIDASRRSHVLWLRRGSDPPDVAHKFVLSSDEIRPFDGFSFTLLGRVTDEPLVRYWRLEPTAGLESGLTIEAWLMIIPVSPAIRAVLQLDLNTGKQRRLVEIDDESDDWESDAPRLVRAIRALHAKVRKPGPKPGTGAKYQQQEDWHQAVRERVLTKQTRGTAEDWRIAHWLDVSQTLLYQHMRNWGPKTLEALRAGNFGDCDCRSCKAN